MGTRRIHFLDLRPSCVAGEATEPFAPKHATTGASISHLQSSYSDLQCRYLSKIVRRKDIPTQELNKPGVYRGRASKRDIFVLTLMPALHKCSFPRFLGNSVWNVESVLPCFTSARYRNSNYPLQHIGNLFRGALGFQSAGMQQAGSQCGDSLCTGQRTCGRESSFEILHAARILSRTTSGYPPGGMAVG